MSAAAKTITVTLTQGQQDAIVKLVAVQARGESKDAEGMASSLLDSVIRGRAIAAAKSAKENDGKAYDAAVAMGFQANESKGEFINRRQIEWAAILGSLGLELRSGEWKKAKSDDEDAE
jgi:hypothetical protein